MLFIKKRDHYIYLPTSLCYEASLPKDFTKDVFKVRKLQNFKINKPNERV